MGRMLKKKPKKKTKNLKVSKSVPVFEAEPSEPTDEAIEEEKAEELSTLGKLIRDTPILSKSAVDMMAEQQRYRNMGKAEMYARMYGGGSPGYDDAKKPDPYDRHSKFYVGKFPVEPLVAHDPSAKPANPSKFESHWHDPNDLVEPDPHMHAAVKAYEASPNEDDTPDEAPSEELNIFYDTEATITFSDEMKWGEPAKPISNIQIKILSQYFVDGSLHARHVLSKYWCRDMSGNFSEMNHEEAAVFIEYCRNEHEPGHEGSCVDFWEEI